MNCVSVDFKGLFAGLFVCLHLQASGQQPYTLWIFKNGESANESNPQYSGDYRKEFSGKEERTRELHNYLYELYDRGYLAASYSALVEDTTHLDAYLSIGNQYLWAHISPGNVDEEILSRVGFRERLYRHKPVRYTSVRRLLERILSWCENNGYPFASVKLDSTGFQDRFINTRLTLNMNREVFIDSIIIEGNIRTASSYLHHCTGIHPGDRYDESLLKNVDKRMQGVPFVRVTKPSEVAFSSDCTNLILHLEDRRASHFSGILGVLPNAGKDNKELLVTGEALLILYGAFGHGERLDMRWRSIQPKTQDLDVKFLYPYLFSTPFGADLRINFYKKDTTYFDLSRYGGIQYYLSGDNRFSAYVNHKKTTLLASEGLEKATALPAHADVSVMLYGLGFTREHLDYRLNPRRGHVLEINGGAGSRKIIRNPKINPALYDTLKRTTVQYNFSGSISLFTPVKSNSTVMARMVSFWIISEDLFENELHRIGGFQTLRGFDEESILSSFSLIGTLEYRYLFEQNSSLFLFADGAYYENLRRRQRGENNWLGRPVGFGAGVNFDSRAGIFTLSYALGTFPGNPLLLKSAKIHFGYVSRF